MSAWREEVLGGGREGKWLERLPGGSGAPTPDPGSGTRSLSSRPPPPGQLLIENLAVIET